VGGGADAVMLDAQALCTSRLGRALPASSCVFAPSTVGKGARRRGGVGDDEETSTCGDAGARQAQPGRRECAEDGRREREGEGW
jgi:hypothetical protein